MKTVKIKFSEFHAASNEGFTFDAIAIKNSVYVTNTATFPAPPVTIAELEDQINNLVNLNSLCDSDNGSHTDRTERDGQREVVYGLLVTIGLYVLSVANAQASYNDKKAIVELSAFPVANDTHNPVERVPVTDLKVNVPTIPGDRTIGARWKRGKCNAFIVQGTMGDPSSPSAEWTQLAVCSKARCEVTLDPGNWAVRIIGLYSSGPASASSPVVFALS